MSGIDPKIWGPGLWKLIHFITAQCQINDILYPDTLNFLKTLRFLIVCRHCREFYTSYYDSNPPSDKKNIFRWGVMLHNNVNKKLNKTPVHIDNAWYYQMNRRQPSLGTMTLHNGFFFIYHFNNNPNTEIVKLRVINVFFKSMYNISRYIDNYPEVPFMLIRNGCYECNMKQMFEKFIRIHKIQDYNSFITNIIKMPGL